MPQNRRATLFPPGGRSCPIGLTWNSSFAALQSQHPPGREVAQPQGTALGYFPKPESVKRNSRWPVPPKWSKPQDFRSGDPPSEASRSQVVGARESSPTVAAAATRAEGSERWDQRSTGTSGAVTPHTLHRPPPHPSRSPFLGHLLASGHPGTSRCWTGHWVAHVLVNRRSPQPTLGAAAVNQFVAQPGVIRRGTDPATRASTTGSEAACHTGVPRQDRAGTGAWAAVSHPAGRSRTRGRPVPAVPATGRTGCG